MVSSVASAARSAGGLDWPPTLTVDWLVFGPLAVSVAFIVVRAIVLDRTRSFSLSNRMGPGSWDPSKSWASNLTVLAATLGAIVAATGLLPTATSQISNVAYAGLDIFFAVLVAVAPLAFNAFRVAQPRHNDHGVKEVQFEGFVGLFLVTAALTLWASIGQLTAILALLQDIKANGSLSDMTVGAFDAIIVATMLVVLVYAWGSIAAIVRSQTDLTTRKAVHAARISSYRATVPADLDPSYSSWSVL